MSIVIGIDAGNTGKIELIVQHDALNARLLQLARLRLGNGKVMEDRTADADLLEHIEIIPLPLRRVNVTHHACVASVVGDRLKALLDQIVKGIGNIDHDVGKNACALGDKCLCQNIGLVVQFLNSRLHTLACLCADVALFVNDA